MADAGGQTIALGINPVPDLGQSYLTAGRIQAQQNQNDMAPLDMAAKQLDLQQKQALAPLELKAAQQKLVLQGMEARSAQTKAQQDAADRTMDRIGRAALSVSNASAADRPGEWKSQLDGLLKTKTIDKTQYDALMKQQPTDDLLNHIKDGHQTYQEMLKADAANKAAAKKAQLTPDQVANLTKDYATSIKSDPNVTQKMQTFSQALQRTNDYAKAVDAAERLGPAGSSATAREDAYTSPGLLPGQDATLKPGADVFGPAAASPAAVGFLPPPTASAAPAAVAAPAATPPVSSNLLPGPDSMARVYAGSQPPTVQSLLNRTAAPPPAAAKTREMQPAKNDKLGGNSEEQVLTHAREAIKADPRLAEPYKQRLKELGIDPGKL